MDEWQAGRGRGTRAHEGVCFGLAEVNDALKHGDALEEGQHVLQVHDRREALAALLLEEVRRDGLLLRPAHAPRRRIWKCAKI